MTDLDTLASEKRAPWHLWTVGVVALLWNAVRAMDFLMTQTRNEQNMSQFTPEQLKYFYGFPAWMIMLLTRKSLAVPVFLVSLIAMVLTTIYQFGLSNELEVVGDPLSLVFTAAIFLIAVALFLYARAMQKRGRLV